MQSRTNASRTDRTQTAIVTCPDCGEKMTLKGVIGVGLAVRCPNCKAELEVVKMARVELDWACKKHGDTQEFLVRW